MTEQKLVPVGELTPAMIDAADRYIKGVALNGSYYLPATFNWHEFWSAMLAAAAPPAPSGWRSMESAPKDGTPFYARHQSPFRFQPYKANSEQARRGIKGRWQTMNEYGGWDNCPEPVGDWTDHPDFPAADHIGDVTEMVRSAPSPDTGMGGATEHEQAWLEAEAQLSEISFAIGSTRFMDPPDGGSVTLAEQVRRMRIALEEAEALSAPVSGGEVAWLPEEVVKSLRGGFGGTYYVRAENERDGLVALYTHPSAPAATERMRADDAAWLQGQLEALMEPHADDGIFREREITAHNERIERLSSALAAMTARAALGEA